MANPVATADISRSIHDAGLSKSVIALHSSLKSFGTLEGGPDTLVQAFLQAGCTLLVPTFSYACQLPYQREIARNGAETRFGVEDIQAMEFDPRANLVSPDMGSIPARILHTPGRVRGQHPLNSLTALGPLAESIIAEQAPLQPYGPYRWLYDYPRAWLVLIGVGLTRATPIHFAEQMAGRRLFHRWGLAGGQAVECETGSCSEGFGNFDPCLRAIEQRIHVGPSLWRIDPFRDFVDRASRAIQANPAITHCDDPRCTRCNDMLLGGPLL
jgi:aminoglycoside 3-N-acetyltransferase